MENIFGSNDEMLMQCCQILLKLCVEYYVGVGVYAQEQSDT